MRFKSFRRYFVLALKQLVGELAGVVGLFVQPVEWMGNWFVDGNFVPLDKTS